MNWGAYRAACSKSLQEGPCSNPRGQAQNLRDREIIEFLGDGPP